MDHLKEKADQAKEWGKIAENLARYGRNCGRSGHVTRGE